MNLCLSTLWDHIKLVINTNCENHVVHQSSILLCPVIKMNDNNFIIHGFIKSKYTPCTEQIQQKSKSINPLMQPNNQLPEILEDPVPLLRTCHTSRSRLGGPEIKNRNLGVIRLHRPRRSSVTRYYLGFLTLPLVECL